MRGTGVRVLMAEAPPAAHRDLDLDLDLDRRPGQSGNHDRPVWSAAVFGHSRIAGEADRASLVTPRGRATSRVGTGSLATGDAEVLPSGGSGQNVGLRGGNSRHGSTDHLLSRAVPYSSILSPLGSESRQALPLRVRMPLIWTSRHRIWASCAFA